MAYYRHAEGARAGDIILSMMIMMIVYKVQIVRCAGGGLADVEIWFDGKGLRGYIGVDLLWRLV